EREATQLAGMPVRIAGPIEVRILATPTITFGRVEFGSAAQPQAKARGVCAELALGSLMRRAVRASELRVVRPQLPLRVAAHGRGTVAVPWRASAKVKAAPSHALFEQLEYTYGPEARALKLTGTAEFRFGNEPRFDSVLSARQADLDRALALPDASAHLPLA